jgi:cytidylate kinase
VTTADDQILSEGKSRPAVDSSNHGRSAEATPSGRLTIAIDGPAGAGKSTVARKVAAQLGYLYIDTGAMYRAATWVALNKRADLENHDEVVKLVEAASIDLKPPSESSGGRIQVFVDGDDVTMIVRSRIITRFVSPISAIAGVRHILVAKQQQLAARGAVVMDGRDIGTVVLPDADIKIFLTASPEIRAQRRLKELKELGQACDYQMLLKEIVDRDHFDSTRKTSPLRKADDALEINTDHLSIDEVAGKILELASKKVAGKAE